jgi:iron-sulfur cluster repair protein YtfE (RIC family)
MHMAKKVLKVRVPALTGGIAATRAEETPSVAEVFDPALNLARQCLHRFAALSLADPQQQVFENLRCELEPHMLKVERILFPAIRLLERSPAPPRFPFGSLNHPIHVMEEEHASAGKCLDKIRELTSDYQAPDDACNTYRVLLESLRELEADMHQHVHKENNVLFPRAADLEAHAAE